MPALAALLPVMGGIIGSVASSGDRQKAEDARTAALQALVQTGIPSYQAEQIVMQNPQLVGQYQTQQEGAENLGNTQMANIHTDPRLALAQSQALDQMAKLGQTAFTPEEQAQMNQMQRQTSGAAQARNASILQNMQQRGVGGSGMELAAKLASNQGADQQQAQASENMSAQAHARALQAMQGAGQMGGQMQAQQFGQQSQQAQAADAIARFNAMNRQNVDTRNTAATNQQNLRQADLAQQMENQRASNANYQNQYNSKLLQQQYEDTMQRAGALNNAYNSNAAGYAQQAQATAQQWANMGGGAGQAAGMMGGGGGGGGGSAPQAAPSGGNYNLGVNTNFDSSAPQYNQGGVVESYDDGGQVPDVDPNKAKAFVNDFNANSWSDTIKRLKDGLSAGLTPDPEPQPSAKPHGQNMQPFNQGGEVHSGLPAFGTTMSSTGGRVHGPEVVPGDAPQNDIVPAMLSPGEIVVPKSHATHPETAHAYLDGVMAGNKRPVGRFAMIGKKFGG